MAQQIKDLFEAALAYYNNNKNMDADICLSLILNFDLSLIKRNINKESITSQIKKKFLELGIGYYKILVDEFVLSALKALTLAYDESDLNSLFYYALSILNLRKKGKLDSTFDIQAKDALHIVSQKKKEKKFNEIVSFDDAQLIIEIGMQHENKNLIQLAITIYMLVHYNSVAQFCIGELMINEYNKNKKDNDLLKDGLEWLRKSSEQNFLPAKNNYVLHLSSLKKEHTEAFKYLSKMVDNFDYEQINNIWHVFHNLAILYINGYGCEENLEKALELLDIIKQSNIKGKEYAIYMMAEIYNKRKELSKAFECYILIENEDFDLRNLLEIYKSKKNIPKIKQLTEKIKNNTTNLKPNSFIYMS